MKENPLELGGGPTVPGMEWNDIREGISAEDKRILFFFFFSFRMNLVCALFFIWAFFMYNERYLFPTPDLVCVLVDVYIVGMEST